MSNNNNSDDHTWLGIAVAGIGVLAMTVMIFLFAVMAFLAFVFTIAALCAWNKPIRIGKVWIEPEEARAFVYRGIAGAGLIPAFLGFASLFFELRIDWNFLPHFALAGYVFGSVGLDFLLDDGEPPRTDSEPSPPQQQLPAPPRQIEPPLEAGRYFRFASWDDEEADRS